MAILEVKGLEKQYGQVKAVNGIGFSVEKGEVFGLLGPNGAGKSTTISMISTLLKPDQGEILFDGQDVIKNPKHIQKRLGIVPQEIALYPTLSGLENLKFWGQAYGLRGSKLQERIQVVSEVIGIGDRLKDKVETYSGGMKRRLNIGAALLHEPELLIMDEPTVGIDPQSRNHILDTVKQLNEAGMTIIYTSHYMEEVEYLCDTIQIMDEGKVIAAGTQDQLVDIIGGKRTISVHFDGNPAPIQQTVAGLAAVESTRLEDQGLIVESVNGKGLIKEILDLALQADLNVENVEVTKPNLEAVFLHLTGKALRD